MRKCEIKYLKYINFFWWIKEKKLNFKQILYRITIMWLFALMHKYLMPQFSLLAEIRLELSPLVFSITVGLKFLPLVWFLAWFALMVSLLFNIFFNALWNFYILPIRYCIAIALWNSHLLSLKHEFTFKWIFFISFF